MTFLHDLYLRIRFSAPSGHPAATLPGRCFVIVNVNGIRIWTSSPQGCRPPAAWDMPRHCGAPACAFNSGSVPVALRRLSGIAPVLLRYCSHGERSPWEQYRSNTGATPEQHQSNTLAAPLLTPDCSMF